MKDWVKQQHEEVSEKLRGMTISTTTPDNFKLPKHSTGAPINQDIEEILENLVCREFEEVVLVTDDDMLEAQKALAQRETDLLTYLSDMYALPLKELQRTVELWRKK